MLEQLLFLVFPVVVVLAGVSDLLTMKISNRFSLALLAAFVVIAPMAIGFEAAAWGQHFAAGGLVLVLAFAMFAFGWIGGGDAKLAAVISLWLGLPHLMEFAVFASLFGGALTLGLLGFRSLPVPLVALRVPWIDRLHNLRDGIPYGIALAAAGLCVYPTTVWLVLAS